MKTTEILIPVWPHHTSTSDKLGMGQRYHDFDGSDSLQLSFRAIPKGADTYQFGDKFKVWADIRLRIWLNYEYGMSVDFLADTSYAKEHYIELLLKTMRWANKRIEGMPKLTIGNCDTWFAEFCKRLRIKRSVQYIRGSNEDVYTPVEEALAILVQELATTNSRLRKAA